LDFSKSKKADMAVMILRLILLSIFLKTSFDCCVTNEWSYTARYFNVIGSDPEGRLGEAPRPELREHGRISGACFDAALGIIPGLKVCH
jgi:UDP-arabinose 4-epimerase